MYVRSYSFFHSEIQNFTVVPKRPFVFFSAKYKILQLYPNGHSFFYSEIWNFAVVPKRPFGFYKRNTKSRIVPKWPFVFFYNETQNFEICTQTASGLLVLVYLEFQSKLMFPLPVNSLGPPCLKPGLLGIRPLKHV